MTTPADDATLRVSSDSATHAIQHEQLAPGAIIAGRYRIISLLGDE